MGTENILLCSGTLIKGVPFRSKKYTDRQEIVNLKFHVSTFTKSRNVLHFFFYLRPLFCLETEGCLHPRLGPRPQSGPG